MKYAVKNNKKLKKHGYIGGKHLYGYGDIIGLMFTFSDQQKIEPASILELCH